MMLFSKFKNFDKVFVTGCQRSGTRIVSKMIAYDTGYDCLEEEKYGVHDERRFEELARESKNVIIHCPAMMHIVDCVVTDSDCVILVTRSSEDVLKSMQRIDWIILEAWRELEKYGLTEGDVRTAKHAVFEARQRERIKNVFDVRYEELAKHSLWIAQENRKGFKSWQTELSPLR